MYEFFKKYKIFMPIVSIQSSLRAKLLAIFAILTIIPLSIVGVVSYSTSFSTIHDNITTSSTQIAEQLNKSIDLIFKDSVKFLKIGNHEHTVNFLRSESESDRYESAKQTINLFKLFRSIHEFDKQIMGIYIIGLNGNNISEREGVYNLNKDMYSIDTVTAILKEPREVHIIPNHQVDYSGRKFYDDVISVGTGIIKLSTNEVLGVIIVDVDKSFIAELCKNIKIGDSGHFTIISDQKKPIFSSSYGFQDEALNKHYIEKVFNDEKGKGYFIEEVDREKKLIVYNTLSITGWKIIGKVKQRDIMKSAYYIKNITFIIAVICMLFTVILYLFISDKLTFPIRDLKNKMKQAESGNLEVKAESSNSDEIADLCHSFNIMLEKIKELLENSIKEHENLKKSELKAMQAQINPHFLYNTLDAIVWMTEANNKEQVVDMTKALSSFFRISLSKGKDWITIKDEIEHVRSYLTIQKMRYRDIMDFDVDVDKEIFEYKILKLTLQPLVENALYHGIKNKRGAGLIVVRGRKLDENRILLEVIDNGNGMNEERLKHVREALNDDSLNISGDSGFGLKNVNQRIKLYYGKQYGLSIESEHTKGTHVTIIIPMER